jgi:hypothetical protein
MEGGLKNLTLVVMAAGLGSRYGGLKQIEAVGPHGEWIVDYSVFDALREGFERVLFVVRDEVEPVLRARFDEALRGRCDVAYVRQETDDLPAGFTRPAGRVKPWGTGHAVLACRGRLAGPFAVVNADDFYGRSAYRLIARHLGGGGGAALVGYPIAATMTEHGTVSRGVCRLAEDGMLASIAERKRVAAQEGAIAYTEDGESWHRLPIDAVASMNFWGFEPSILPEIQRRFERFLGSRPGPSDEFFIPVVVGEMVAEGVLDVRVLRSEDEWFGVTYRADLGSARAGINRLVERGAYPSPLWGEG